MITLENVSIDTLGLGNRRIQWQVEPTHENLNTYVLDLYRAEAPGQLAEFDVVQSGIESTEGMYIDSGLERMDHSTNRQIYYYLDARNTGTSETSLFGPYVMKSEPDYVANEILRRYTLFFNNPRYKTRTFQILKKRTWGNYCACFDPIAQEARDESCEFCYGTGIEGGYFAPIAVRGMRADKPSRQMINLFGAWHDTNVMFKLQNTVDVIPGDYIIDEHNERWLIEGPVNHLQKGIYTIMSNVRAKSVSKSDQIYNYDLSEEFGAIPAIASGTEFSVFNGTSSLVDCGDDDLFSFAQAKDHAVFNGTSSVVTVADDDLLSFTDGVDDKPFSISVWAKVNSYAALTSLVAKSNNSSLLEYYFYFQPGGALSLTLYDPDVLFITRNTGSGIRTDAFHHYVVTYDGSLSTDGIKIYIDSARSDTFSSTNGIYSGMENTTQPLELGKVSTYEFDGLMKDVKIFDTELTQSQVDEEFANQSLLTGIVAYYPLAGTSNDFSGNNLNGTPTDIVYGSEADNPFSISGWFYIDDYTNYRPFVVKSDDSTNHEWIFISDDSKNLIFSVYTSAGNFIGRNKLNYNGSGGWHHYVATYNGNKTAAGMKIYVDTVQVDEEDNNSGTYAGMSNTDQSVEIGKWGPSYNYKGRAKDIKIFSKELSQLDINQEYATNDYTIGMIAYYKLYENTADSGRYGLDGTNIDITFAKE